MQSRSRAAHPQGCPTAGGLGSAQAPHLAAAAELNFKGVVHSRGLGGGVSCTLLEYLLTSRVCPSLGCFYNKRATHQQSDLVEDDPAHGLS